MDFQTQPESEGFAGPAEETFNPAATESMPAADPPPQPVEGGAATSTGEDETNAPFIVGMEGQDGAFNPLGGASNKHKLYSGSMLIVVVAIIAVVGLFSMRTITRVSASTTGDQTIDETINNFLDKLAEKGITAEPTSAQSLMERNNRIMTVLRESYADRQVALEDLQRNPFVLLGIMSDDGPAYDPALDAARAIEEAKAQRQADILQVSKTINLQSTMLGSTPLANISNSIVTVGDPIVIGLEGVTANIKSIGSDSVTILFVDAALEIETPVTITIKRD